MPALSERMVMHVAFFTPPAPGHVNPVLPLVAELVRRGHRVSYAVGRAMAGAVRSAGAEPVPLPSDIPESTLAATGFTAQDLAAILESVHDVMSTDLPVLHGHFRADPPEVFCFDPINSFDFADQRLLAAQQALADFAADNGLGALPDTMNEVPAPLNLVLVPKEFQPGGDTFDERFRFVGPSPRPEDATSWQPPESGRPLVYISLGTAFNERPEFYRTCMEAFADGRWDVALSAGSRVDPAALGALPDNVDVRAHFPQQAVLSRAGAFISHCGMGSTMESLVAGVPLVAVPQVPEQHSNARRVEELGLGRILAEATAESIRATVESVAADAEIRGNLDAMRRMVRAGGGAVAAADALEEYGGER